MAEKAAIPAPIDRGLAKAYLREFEGWATAYPPGLASPASLAKMENIEIGRDGGAKIRPGLRSIFGVGVWMDTMYNASMVGGWEHFILNDGTPAILFAARLSNGSVKFYVGKYVATAGGRYDIVNNLATIFDLGTGGESALNFSSRTSFIRYLQIDNKILALSDGGDTVRIFHVGAVKRARAAREITRPNFNAGDALTIYHPNATWITDNILTAPTAAQKQTPRESTLISSVSANNKYTYGFFYTFESDLGESAPSRVTYITAQRPWSQWEHYAPNTDGDRGAATSSPDRSRDQLVAMIPTGSGNAFDTAKSQGATRWNLYMFTWSDQDSVPFEAVQVARRDIEPATLLSHGRWLRATAEVDLSSVNGMVPFAGNRVNYTTPSRAAQGLVAGDRLILVNDREDRAVIRWSSNRIAEYTNFSSSQGGGIKTLTTGNLQVPHAVVLWQNPQSVDTITVLCAGLNGSHSSYYMAPASVQGGQSNDTAIMGFEETTATPGTVSPYGVEVLNNMLYHPLDTELMKSSASNYTITHDTITRDIDNKWKELSNKINIISAQYDNKLYYIVHNPEGERLITGCKGNEIWVYDASKDAGSWSRWLIQGISLGTMDLGGKLYLTVTRPEGIFVLDEYKITDDASASTGTVQKAIPWMLETNTQGANKAHDAWASLQQINVGTANYLGPIRYGVRGRDHLGRLREISKTSHHPMNTSLIGPRAVPFEVDDHLRGNYVMKEWSFFAESVVEGGQVQPSFGQISHVQYLVMPASVNVGYEYGNVESFEYSRDLNHATSTVHYNGIPLPKAERQPGAM